MLADKLDVDRVLFVTPRQRHTTDTAHEGYCGLYTVFRKKHPSLFSGIELLSIEVKTLDNVTDGMMHL